MYFVSLKSTKNVHYLNNSDLEKLLIFLLFLWDYAANEYSRRKIEVLDRVTRREERCTWREQKPSFSGVLTWETMLSSTHSTVIGILAPHLSQSALIPHFTAISPVRLELGLIKPGFRSIIRFWMAASEQRNRSGEGESTAKRCRRETKPLENASMAELHKRIRVKQSESKTWACEELRCAYPVRWRWRRWRRVAHTCNGKKKKKKIRGFRVLVKCICSGELGHIGPPIFLAIRS